MGGCESALLNLCKIVLRVSVQNDLTNWNQRVITVGNNLSDIEDIKLVSLSSLLGDELNIPCP
jgi:hypothetical protein